MTTSEPISGQSDDLILPLESGKSVSFPRMSEKDYTLMLKTLKLWKKRMVFTPKTIVKGVGSMDLVA